MKFNLRLALFLSLISCASPHAFAIGEDDTCHCFPYFGEEDDDGAPQSGDGSVEENACFDCDRLLEIADQCSSKKGVAAFGASCLGLLIVSPQLCYPVFWIGATGITGYQFLKLIQECEEHCSGDDDKDD